MRCEGAQDRAPTDRYLGGPALRRLRGSDTEPLGTQARRADGNAASCGLDSHEGRVARQHSQARVCPPVSWPFLHAGAGRVRLSIAERGPFAVLVRPRVGLSDRDDSAHQANALAARGGPAALQVVGRDCKAGRARAAPARRSAAAVCNRAQTGAAEAATVAASVWPRTRLETSANTRAINVILNIREGAAAL
eukprot:scaffold8179_cov430-Prasinococcus_capsulatus_cf.AAC.13